MERERERDTHTHTHREVGKSGDSLHSVICNHAATQQSRLHLAESMHRGSIEKLGS